MFALFDPPWKSTQTPEGELYFLSAFWKVAKLNLTLKQTLSNYNYNFSFGDVNHVTLLMKTFDLLMPYIYMNETEDSNFLDRHFICTIELVCSQHQPQLPRKLKKKLFFMVKKEKSDMLTKKSQHVQYREGNSVI